MKARTLLPVHTPKKSHCALTEGTGLRNLLLLLENGEIAIFTSRESSDPPDTNMVRWRCHPLSGAQVAALVVARSPRARSSMWLASAVGSLNVARLGGVSLKPVVNGQVSSTEAPVEAGSLWAGTGAVIFTVRRAG